MSDSEHDFDGSNKSLPENSSVRTIINSLDGMRGLKLPRVCLSETEKETNAGLRKAFSIVGKMRANFKKIKNTHKQLVHSSVTWILYKPHGYIDIYLQEGATRCRQKVQAVQCSCSCFNHLRNQIYCK
jgi:hypothetical protein